MNENREDCLNYTSKQYKTWPKHNECAHTVRRHFGYRWVFDEDWYLENDKTEDVITKQDWKLFKSGLQGRENMKWISVNDKMPKKRVRVILYDESGLGAITGRLGVAGWYLEGVLNLDADVTHWMPLPEPPED